MKEVISIRKFSRRVIRFFNSLIHYSKHELGSEITVMSEHEKPVWIKRDGVDVAVVITPELFEELVSAQEELEDIAAVDEALKDEITISGVKYIVGPDIDLDVEVVLDKQGNRLTNERAQEIAQEISHEARAEVEAQIKKRLARQNKAVPVDIDEL
jgi:PHD/YefM family antitoxin component YafN of YafNO toxin-antitoxin module